MKVPKPSKKKIPSIKSLKNKLWKKHSLYIRKRDEKSGCISCGVVKPYKEMHAGHYYEKSTCTLPGYFSYIGVNGQCPQCNSYKSGNKDNYALALERIYGHGILQELDEERKMIVSNERLWILERLRRIEKELAELGIYQ